jgi:four helix bundle protein
MPFKFEKLEVWRLALDYIDLVYDLAAQLPKSEEYNLKSQISRAATSIALNIAEGSTSQTDAEQARFLGLAIRSLIETVACLHIIRRRTLVQDQILPNQIYHAAELLVANTVRKTTAAPRVDRLREYQLLAFPGQISSGTRLLPFATSSWDSV